MRILLISTNRSSEIMPCMPVGPVCLPPMLPEHEVGFLDLFFEEDPESAIERTISELQPGLIGFSLRNVDNQLWSRTEYYLPEAKRYIEVARRESKMPIIVGGAAYGIFPNAALRYLGADWGVTGDGEIILPQLIKALENCCDPSGIEGVISPADERGRFIAPRIEDYDNIPFPALDMIRISDYQANGGAISIIARRGCAYDCIYCDAPVSEGKKIRGKSPKRLVDEMENALRHGIKSIHISDNIFNNPPAYARAVAEEVIRRGLDLTWGATLHPSGVVEEDIRLLKKSGFKLSSVGPDSGSPKMLDRLGKGCAIEEVRNLVSLLKKYEIGFYMSILLGGPGENRETVKESIDFAVNSGANMTGIRVGIRVTPLTRLHKIALDEGVLAADDNLMEPRFYVSVEISDWAMDYLYSELKGVKGVFVQ